MTLQQLKIIIKKHNWWTENMPGSFRLISGWRGFILQNKLYRQRFASIIIGMYRDDLLWEQTIWQEKIDQFFRVLKIYQKNPKGIHASYQQFLKTKKALIVTGEDSLAKLYRLSNKEVGKIYKKFYDIYTEFFGWSLMPECGDAYSDERLLSDFKKASKKTLTENELSEASIILSTFPFLSFVEEHRLEFLKLCLSKNPDYTEFAKKYHWVQNNYLKTKALTPKYFQKERAKILKRGEKEIQEELKNLKRKANQLKVKQTRLLKKLHLPQNLRQTFELLRIFSRWIDERKFCALHCCYYVEEFLKEISKRTNISIELLNYYTPEEVVELIAKRVNIPSNEAKKRRKLSVYIATAKGIEGFNQSLFTGKEASIIFNLFEKERQKNCKGFVANAPVLKYKGKVQIILNPHKEKFKKGRILVTTMTRPDFAPILRQASAVITDEGGITCHAAIISRELGTPCIIGTKVATKTFKDGDIVEIDFQKGVIKKIK